ncbi:MAG TPA: 4Fe-4S binding protein [Thermoplasmata archaeon]|nr:4Fe-4S binding protein [Thermoplasmata archaeon]
MREIFTTISRPVKGATEKTGQWRTFKPLLDKKKCTRCLRCWILCPDGAIQRNEDESVEINLEYCKGCGICANECPVKAIRMVREE